MLYRVRLDLSFPSESPATDIIEEALRRLPVSVTIAPGTPLEERGYVMMELCGHDQTPPIPCVTLSQEQSPLP